VDRERASTVSREHRSLGIKAASSRATQASRSGSARVRTYILSFVNLSTADRVLFRSENPIFIYTDIFGVSTCNEGALTEGRRERDLNCSYFLRGKLTRGDVLLWKGGTLLWGIAAGVPQNGCRQLNRVAKMMLEGLPL